MTTNELITKEDLKEFKNELLQEIKQLMHQGHGQSKKWLKSNEVRRMLDISMNTLQTLRSNGTLRHTKIGGILYYKLDDIYKTLEGNR